MSLARPETEEEWQKLEVTLSRCSQPLRSEMYLILDMDIRRQLVERECARQLRPDHQPEGKL